MFEDILVFSMPIAGSELAFPAVSELLLSGLISLFADGTLKADCSRYSAVCDIVDVEEPDFWKEAPSDECDFAAGGLRRMHAVSLLRHR